MEEYTNQFLYFKGKVSDEPNSEIFAKTLMVDEIPIKDFRRRVLVMTDAYTGTCSYWNLHSRRPRAQSRADGQPQITVTSPAIDREAKEPVHARAPEAQQMIAPFVYI